MKLNVIENYARRSLAQRTREEFNDNISLTLNWNNNN